MNFKGNGRLLASHILRLRPENKLQKDLAREIDVTPSFISQVESGETVPSDERLATWARGLGAESSFPLLLLCAAHDRVGDGSEAATVRETYRRMIRELEATRREPAGFAKARTLADLKAFAPMVIVAGDKREDPPKTEGDVGALSASPHDDRYLHDVSLPQGTDKISDKVFVHLKEEQLRREFGKINLLVIGSPASNHLSRIVNRHALFRFAFNPDTVNEIEGIIENARIAKKDGPGALKVARDTALRDLKFIMNEFKQGGIFDPLPDRHKVRAKALREGIDFATITVARNPFAENDDFVAIMAAGFHLPGTIHAVKMLSEPDRFANHPFGGVLEVKMNADAPWHEKIQRGEAQIETSSYSIDDMRKALTGISDHPEWPGVKEEATELNKLVAALAQPRAGQPKSATP